MEQKIQEKIISHLVHEINSINMAKMFNKYTCKMYNIHTLLTHWPLTNNITKKSIIKSTKQPT